MSLLKVVSGGQSGVDRAALDSAMALGICCAGWCPSGRRAEDGTIDLCYPLRETPSRSYGQRTGWNVQDSDGTLILYRGVLRGGTRLTRELAMKMHKPVQLLDLDAGADPATVFGWIQSERIHILNVAGPRESQCPGIYKTAGALLYRLFVLLINRR